MLHGNFDRRSLERALPHNPFIDHDSKRVLITGRTWLALDLFRGHVRQRAADALLEVDGMRTVSDGGDAKVTE